MPASGTTRGSGSRLVACGARGHWLRGAVTTKRGRACLAAAASKPSSFGEQTTRVVRRPEDRRRSERTALTARKRRERWRPTWRWTPPALLFLVALAAVVLTAVSSDPTWRSIWIGVTTTALASGLVDGSAVLERERQLAPVRRLAGRRIGRLHQLLLQAIATVFDDVQTDRSNAWPAALRAAADAPVDLTTLANVYPPRSRQQRLVELAGQLDDELEELSSLAAAGVLTRELDKLDEALRSAPFMLLLRDAFPGQPLWRGRAVMAQDAAALLERVQETLPAAATAAGSSWRHGHWPT